MFIDQAEALCRKMAEETLARIRDDRKRASVKVAELLAMIEERLFDPDLQVETLRRWCGNADKNVSARFAEELGYTPWAYITRCRMEIAARLLAGTDVKVWRIATNVGYLTANSFGRAFKRWAKMSPGAFRERAAKAPAAAAPPAPAELVSHEELRRALDGDLPVGETEALLGQLGELQDRIVANYQVLTPPPPRAAWIEPLMAENLWSYVEDLPHEAQMAAVKSQAGAFRTAALFHRLCTVSIEIGAEDDVRGLQLASLAMSAFEAVGGRLKDPNLFARAYAVSGLAFQRSGKLDDAGQCFGAATRLLELAGDDVNPVVTMELCLYQAIFHLERDEVESAAMLLDSARQLHRALLAKLAQQDSEGAAADAATEAADPGG